MSDMVGKDRASGDFKSKIPARLSARRRRNATPSLFYDVL